MNKKESAHILDLLHKLLSAGEAGTHEEIGAALEKEGFIVNQPKISRLLHRIGAIKIVTAKGKYLYRLPHEHKLAHELSEISEKNSLKSFVLNIVANETLIIVRTIPGGASFIARVLDQDQTPLHILGTIAGDDTIFVVPTQVHSIAVTLEKIKKKLLG